MTNRVEVAYKVTMSESGKPTTSSLAEEKARLLARLEKIAQLEKLASELGVSISGEFGAIPTFPPITTTANASSIRAGR